MADVILKALAKIRFSRYTRDSREKFLQEYTEWQATAQADRLMSLIFGEKQENPQCPYPPAHSQYLLPIGDQWFNFYGFLKEVLEDSDLSPLNSPGAGLFTYRRASHKKEIALVAEHSALIRQNAQLKQENYELKQAISKSIAPLLQVLEQDGDKN